MSIAIIIPSRLTSTRLPEKPLLPILGIPLLARVIQRIQALIVQNKDIRLIVACDDARVAELARSCQAEVCMTDPDLPSGTDRVFYAASTLENKPEFIINIQGDALFMPIEAIEKLIALMHRSKINYATAALQLTWHQLSVWQQHKQLTPSSGTSAIVVNDKAIWFSKQILPYLRMNNTDNACPVLRHLGIYAYHYDFLQTFVSWKPSHYERIEGLEQLRAIEHGYTPDCIIIEAQHTDYMSVDTPEDVSTIERLLKASAHP